MRPPVAFSKLFLVLTTHLPGLPPSQKLHLPDLAQAGKITGKIQGNR
jgi:hypothetical protein